MDVMTEQLAEQRFSGLERKVARLEDQVERLRQIESRRSIDRLQMAGAVLEGLLYACYVLVLVILLMSQP